MTYQIDVALEESGYQQMFQGADAIVEGDEIRVFTPLLLIDSDQAGSEG